MARLLGLLTTCLLVSGLVSVPDRSWAGPLCSDAGLFPVSLASFVSCVVEGEQDTLPNVQGVLDDVLTTSVLLQGSGSFCPGPECADDAFTGSSPGDGFVIDPATLPGSISFEFEELPPGTLFITLMQAGGFEIFKVPGPVPFTLTHQLNGEDTSHISTFVPEPTLAALVALGLLAGAWVGRGRGRVAD